MVSRSSIDSTGEADRNQPGRSIVQRVIIGSIVLFFVIQLVPYGRDHINPPVIEEPAWDSATTRQLFYRACGDCHSNETIWPWYSNIAPISWLVQHDVKEARGEFNVSEWHRPDNKGDEAAEEVREGEMPLWFYLPAHPEAYLSEKDKKQFLTGLVATFGEKLEEDDDEDH